jgi:hypothetical protein
MLLMQPLQFALVEFKTLQIILPHCTFHHQSVYQHLGLLSQTTSLIILESSVS